MQQESVLQPSHFSASQERRLRQYNADGGASANGSGSGTGTSVEPEPWGTAGYDDADDNNNVVVGGPGGIAIVGLEAQEELSLDSNTSPFIFRPHEEAGEEIFVMAPSSNGGTGGSSSDMNRVHHHHPGPYGGHFS